MPSGTIRADFFSWLAECGINTQQIVEEARKAPNVWITCEYDVEDDRVGKYPLSVTFNARAAKTESDEEILQIANAEVVELRPAKAAKALPPIDETKPGEVREAPPAVERVRPDGIQLVKNADGTVHARIPVPELKPHPFTRWPRNAPCFCGSGRKFKKCHGPVITPWVIAKDEPTLAATFKKLEGKMETLPEAEFNAYAQAELGIPAAPFNRG